MNFYCMTLFPEMVRNTMQESIIGRAMEAGILSLDCINIRDFTTEKHGHVDDYPYGGGAGMVMKAQPVIDAYKHVENMIKEKSSDFKKTRVIFVTPGGKTFDQKMSEELALEDNLVFLCGHYEGIDERALEMIVTDNVSIGDYVLTGGELPAMVMMDSISRNIKGVLSNEDSAEDESFKNGLLEYPQYTRPEEYMGRVVPQILLSGHHAKIAEYRRKESLLRTMERRPDLIDKAMDDGSLDKSDIEFIRNNQKHD